MGGKLECSERVHAYLETTLRHYKDKAESYLLFCLLKATYLPSDWCLNVLFLYSSTFTTATLKGCQVFGDTCLGTKWYSVLSKVRRRLISRDRNNYETRNVCKVGLRENTLLYFLSVNDIVYIYFKSSM